MLVTFPRTPIILLALLVIRPHPGISAETNPAPNRATADYVPNVVELATPVSSELRELVERFVMDRADLERFYDVKGSAARQRRLREFYTAWLGQLAKLD